MPKGQYITNITIFFSGRSFYMNNQQKYFSLAMLLATACCIQKLQADIFSDMIAEMEEMHETTMRHMKQMRESFTSNFDNSFAPELVARIDENKDNNTITVHVVGLEGKDKTFDASMDSDENKLTITTPAATIAIKAQDRFMVVDMYHEVTQEQEKDTYKMQHMMAGHNQLAQSLSAEPKLNEAIIEYDADPKTLAIIIPLTKKVATKIPITIKAGNAKARKEEK